jgi:3-phenylpropionate/cinnamic acid dioxygenase small subunit
VNDAVDHERQAPVTPDVLFTVERFLYAEARLLMADQQRKWLTTLVHPDIRYQVFVRELRLKKDSRLQRPDRAYVYDERFSDLDARVRQFETGMQWRVDPPERLRYLISNIEAFQTEKPNDLLVYSNCLAIRNRRVYEESSFVYGRSDILRRNDDGAFRLLSREVDYDQRYIEGRNLMFFL